MKLIYLSLLRLVHFRTGIKVGILFSKLHQFTVCFRTHVLYYGHISKFKAIGYSLYQQPVEQVFKLSTILINFLTQRHFCRIYITQTHPHPVTIHFSVIYTTYIYYMYSKHHKRIVDEC